MFDLKNSQGQDFWVGIYDDVQENAEELLEIDCGVKVKIAGAYVKAKVEFINMLSEFGSMSEGHFIQKRSAKHLNQLKSADEKPTHFSPYLVDPNARKFKKNKTKRFCRKKLSAWLSQKGQNKYCSREIKMLFPLLCKLLKTKRGY